RAPGGVHFLNETLGQSLGLNAFGGRIADFRSSSNGLGPRGRIHFTLGHKATLRSWNRKESLPSFGGRRTVAPGRTGSGGRYFHAIRSPWRFPPTGGLAA